MDGDSEVRGRAGGWVEGGGGWEREREEEEVGGGIRGK